MVGVIPGLGGSVVGRIAYSHDADGQEQENFGGDVRGVIRPESSSNAKGRWACQHCCLASPVLGRWRFISAIALLGTGSIEVGPSMLKNNLDFTYAIVWLWP